jgi:hypothetical protein
MLALLIGFFDNGQDHPQGVTDSGLAGTQPMADVYLRDLVQGFPGLS